MPREEKALTTSDKALRIRITQDQVEERKRQPVGCLTLVRSGARFHGADARGLDLSGFAWTGEDFTNCDLRGANLSGCKFGGASFERAELWNADLSGSDLTGITGLLPEQLAATNLKGAKLPDSLTKFEPLEASAKLADNASKVFLTMLSAVAFTFLTLATTTDVQLFGNSSNTKLPVLSTDVPILGFYIAIPLVLIALFIYFHIYLQRLWEALAKLPAVFPDGRRLDERSHPWLLGDLVRRYVPWLRQQPLALSWLQSSISFALGYGVVPVTLAALWWRLLVLHDWRMIGFQLVILAVATGFAFCCLVHVQNTFKNDRLKSHPLIGVFRSFGVGPGIPAGIVVGLLGMCLSHALFRIADAYVDYREHHVLQGKDTRLGLYLSRALLWSAYASLEGADLRGGHLEGAHLQGAGLWNARLKGIHLQGAQLQHAYLLGADFSDADLWSAHFRAAHLRNAHLQRAHLQHADFRGADLQQADFSDANLSNAHLRGANLMGAHLRGADLYGAELVGADLRHADLQDANLNGANLDGAVVSDLKDLNGMKGIYKGKVIVNPKDDQAAEGLPLVAIRG